MKPERSLILSTSVGALTHTALLFSLFLLFAGHSAPGGGFIGGLVAGAAAVLRYVDGGSEALRRVFRLWVSVLLAAGLTLALLTGMAPWLFGGQLLEAGHLDLDLPLFGAVHLGSALAFDIGVYLVVFGLVLGILNTLGGEPQR